MNGNKSLTNSFRFPFLFHYSMICVVDLRLVGVIGTNVILDCGGIYQAYLIGIPKTNSHVIS